MLETLVVAGATALVGAMATDAWQAARTGFANLFGRGDQQEQELANRRLNQATAQVAKADHDDQDRVQAQLPTAQQAWVQHNLARDHGTVYGVQAGDQHIHYHDAPGPPASRPEGVERPPEGGQGAE